MLPPGGRKSDAGGSKTRECQIIRTPRLQVWGILGFGHRSQRKGRIPIMYGRCHGCQKTSIRGIIKGNHGNKIENRMG